MGDRCNWCDGWIRFDDFGLCWNCRVKQNEQEHYREAARFYVQEMAPDHNSGCECSKCDQKHRAVETLRMHEARERLVARHEAEQATAEREADTEQVRLIADYLGQLDRDYPSYLVTGHMKPANSAWVTHRAAYIKGDPAALDRMLSVVTGDNPPLAAIAPPRPVQGPVAALLGMAWYVRVLVITGAAGAAMALLAWLTFITLYLVAAQLGLG